MSLVRIKDKDLKPLSEADRVRLRKVARKPIDYSDIPELPDDWFDRAQRAVEVATQTKSQIALRLDDDVIAWFRRQGAGYQTKMNAVLRSYMDAATVRGR